MHVPSNLGALDPLSIFAAAFPTVEVRTTATPPLVINMQGPPNPATKALMDQLRPTLIFSGPAGRYVIAPSGEATQANALDFSGSALKLGLGVGAALLGVALLGAAISR